MIFLGSDHEITHDISCLLFHAILPSSIENRGCLLSVLYASNVKFYPGLPVTTLIRVCAHAWY